MASKISIIFGALVCLSSFAHAQSGGSEPLDLEARFYEQIAIESGIEVEKPAVKGLLGEVPDGLSYKDMSLNCDPRRFEDSVINKRLSNKQFYAYVKQYFAKCGPELSSKGTTGLLGLLKFAMFQYPFLEHPQIKEFKIKTESGAVLPAIVALKQDPRPRPTVVVRCGVFCSAEPSASLKSYMMHLFDQSPFNVVLIASQTGKDYIMNNNKVTMGGWSEGYETLEAGKWLLQKWEYRERISSLHLMGISLGGNTAVLGAAFNDKYTLSGGRKIFNSATAICPVVSLRSTLDKLYSGQIVGRVFAEVTRGHFRDTRVYVKDVPEMLTDSKIPWFRNNFPEFIGNLASTALNKRGIASTGESFYKSNNFWNVKEDVKTPLMLWASSDDIIVNNGLNAGGIEKNDRYARSEAIGVLNLPYGNHCAFSAAYGAQASATVLRTFVLNNSPEFVKSYDVKKEMAWSFGFDALTAKMQHVKQSWTFTPGSKQVKVDFKLFNGTSSSCAKEGPFKPASSSCYQTKSRWVSVASLKSLGARVPSTEAEAQALSREFNTKVEFKAKGNPLNGTNNTAFYMSWRSHFE